MRTIKIVAIGAIALCAAVSAALPRSIQAESESPRPREAQVIPRPLNRDRGSNLRDQREDIRDRREDMRERQEDRMNNLQKMHVKRELNFEEHRDRLENNLKVIRDERKKDRVRRVNEELNRLNARLTKHFADFLNHLEEVLLKIEGRIARAKERGWDGASAEGAAQQAAAAITSAHEKVAAQAGKTYEIGTFANDEELRAAVEAARNQLHEDLKATRGAVFEARTAVHATARELATVAREHESSGDAPEAGTGENTGE